VIEDWSRPHEHWLSCHSTTPECAGFKFQAAQNLLKKRIKLTELLPLTRYQPGLLAVDVQDSAKAVVVQLIYPVGMTDRLL
jgi:hypothetical protein